MNKHTKILGVVGAIGAAMAMTLTNVAAAQTNLCLTGSIHSSSGSISEEEKDLYLIDGSLATKWCAGLDQSVMPDELWDLCYHYVVIDLGAEKTFDNYKLQNASVGERDLGQVAMDSAAWILQYGDPDTNTWTTIDDVQENVEPAYAKSFDAVTARYVRLLVVEPEQGDGTTTRLYELEVYGEDTGAAPAAETTATPAGDTTVAPAAGDTTVAPAADDTTVAPAADDTTVAPADDTTVAPADDAAAPAETEPTDAPLETQSAQTSDSGLIFAGIAAISLAGAAIVVRKVKKNNN